MATLTDPTETPVGEERETEHFGWHDTAAGPQLGQPEELQSKGPFASLVENFRDAFFPEKLPPLVLESQPIAVVNRMDVKRDPKSTAVAVGVHALIILLIFWISSRVIKVVNATKPKVAEITFEQPPPPQPILKVPSPKPMGGGGGAHDIAPVTQGRLPKFSPTPIVPPSNPPKIEPKLTVDPAINVQTNLHMTNNNMPNLGIPNAPNVGVNSLGNGSGGGLGSGRGNGLGNGSGGNTGGGVYSIGGDVSAPQLIYQVDPEFSEEARKAKFQGEVLVHLIVDATGRPTQVRVIRPVGMGLDEKAREAVAQYKFKPARKGGQAVPVELNVAVNFQIF
ncbi:MAG: energy transducer TonB [Janthinobacterium lividum]